MKASNQEFKPRWDLGFAKPGERHLKDSVVEYLETGELFSMITRQSVAELKAEGYEVVNVEEFTAELEKSLTTPPKRISRSDYMNALEVLPPHGWTNNGDSESFYMSEFYSGRVTSHYVRVGKDYFEFMAPVMSNHTDRIRYVLDWQESEALA